jgi:hypothetical protein
VNGKLRFEFFETGPGELTSVWAGHEAAFDDFPGLF